MKRILISACLLQVFVSAAIGCTFVYLHDGEVCLAGNNEDWQNPNTFMWFVPGKNGSFGRVYFGFDDRLPQGGMNEKGLCFDYMATDSNPVKRSKNKPNYEEDIMDFILSKCSTVEDALGVLDQYNLEWMEKVQVMMGDASGNSAIIEGDEVIRKKGKYQICTNFYQSKLSRDQYPCPRYEIADSLFLHPDRSGIALIRQILSSVHAEGSYPTQYSNIYDLTNRTVTVYHFHNFENSIIVNLKDELAKGPHVVRLDQIFPRTHWSERFRSIRTR